MRLTLPRQKGTIPSMGQFIVIFAGIVTTMFTVFSSNHPAAKPVAPSTQHAQVRSLVRTTPASSPIPTPSELSAQGSLTLYNRTVYITLSMPKEGGEVAGSISGACSGNITGTYTGGDHGNLAARVVATCPILITSITGTGDMVGVADVIRHSINAKYTVDAQGTTKSGYLTLSLL